LRRGPTADTIVIAMIRFGVTPVINAVAAGDRGGLSLVTIFVAFRLTRPKGERWRRWRAG
jgi:ABC-type spermidine/putrescine transport system permease subunit II